MSDLAPIVAAAIVDSLACPSKVFVTARAYPAQLRGLFEFPGGKVDVGESVEDALLREIREELGVDVRLGRGIVQDDGSWWPLANGRVMGVWLAEVVAGDLCVGDAHVEGRWVALSSVLYSLPWIPADRPIVDALLGVVSGVEGGVSSSHPAP